jgi:hypothetical protein
VGDSCVVSAAPPRTMLARMSPGCGTRLTAPSATPSTRMMRLSPSETSGRKRWIIQGSRESVVNMSKSEPKLGSSSASLNTPAPPLP